MNPIPNNQSPCPVQRENNSRHSGSSQDLPDDIIQTLRSLIPALLDEFATVDILYVFGSMAAGTSDECSDVDIAVYLDPARVAEDCMLDLSLGLWLQERLGRDIDVVVMNGASPVLCHEVLRTGVRLFEKCAVQRAMVELRVFKAYMDVRHYQQKREGIVAHGQ